MPLSQLCLRNVVPAGFIRPRLTAARSTIQDADFAAETANETRASVLQQAGVAVLGQANSQPQQILSLLQHL